MNILDKIRHLFKPMLNCEQVNAFLMDYVEGRLPEDTLSRFEMHLKMCASCTPFLDQYKKTIELASTDGQIAVPEDLAELTLSFLRQNLPDFNNDTFSS